jgi:DUF438 domain-containing protein
MSEQINNREYRKKVIKDILRELHKGANAEDVREKFLSAFDGVSASEISEAEQALISEGLPIEEVQRLCDVHASVFKGSIEEIHAPADPGLIPGHPVNVLKKENRYLEKVIEEQIQPFLTALPDKNAALALKQGLNELGKVHIHYLRKENLFFPYMEKYGITAPPKVMWGVDDEIRALIKEAARLAEENAPDLKDKAGKAAEQVREMIFKEENILLPMLTEILTEDEWRSIAGESGEIGFIIEDVPVWKRAEKSEAPPAPQSIPGVISLPSGSFSVDELTHLLNTLPLDITFVDKDDTVKYFSQGKERIFPRATAIIGRNVSNCHPPASVHIVEKIVADLRSGKKEHEDFWIKTKDAYIFIRYFAVRNEKGEYLGALEITQNIKPIQEISGEKRLLSD